MSAGAFQESIAHLKYLWHFFFHFQSLFKLYVLYVWWVGVYITPRETHHRNMSGTKWRESSMIQTQSSWLFYFSVSSSLSLTHAHEHKGDIVLCPSSLELWTFSRKLFCLFEEKFYFSTLETLCNTLFLCLWNSI